MSIRMRISQKVGIALIGLVVLCTFSLCVFIVYLANVTERGEVVASYEEEIYEIDSQTILQDLSQGNKDVFQPLPNGHLTLTPETIFPSVEWTGVNYLTIANQFNKHISNENLENWKYLSISYSMDCSDFKYGPQQAIYEVGKNNAQNGNDIKVERQLWILPKQNRVEWYETQYDIYYSYVTFEIEEIKISLEDAIKIAEEQGGTAFRLKEDNQCRIVVEIIAGIQENNWQIWYTSDDNQYVIYVDKETGEYQIVEP